MFLVFDLDGTLADSAGCVAACMLSALETHGLPPVPPAAVTALIGLPLDTMVTRLVPAGADAPAVTATYRARYPDLAREQECLFPGVRDLLAGLAAGDHVLAIATGKSQRGADRATEELGIRPYFRTIRGGNSVPRGKPWPDLLHQVLEDLGAPPEEALMIGDTTYDLQMARAAGVRSCAVTWGVHPRERLAEERPDWMVDEMEALAALLPPRRNADEGTASRP